MMPTMDFIPTARFVTSHFVDEDYHKQHSQLIHQHDNIIELLYIKQGSGSYIVGEHTYILQPGSLVLCNANVVHGEPSFQNHKLRHEMQSYCCVLTDLQLPNLPPNTLVSSSAMPVIFFSADKEKEIAENLFLMIHQLSLQLPLYADTCEKLANSLLSLLYVKLQEHQQNSEQLARNNEDFILTITDYLDKHYMEPLSLPELGERFHISYYYLSHVYKAETGISPMKYVHQRRIGQSQNLLMNTRQSIGDISDLLGFSDTCHFSSTFKKYVGLSPTQYRKYFRA